MAALYIRDMAGRQDMRNDLVSGGLGPAGTRAAEYGIDLLALQENLQLTLAERCRRHARALRDCHMLREALRQRDPGH